MGMGKSPAVLALAGIFFAAQAQADDPPVIIGQLPGVDIAVTSLSQVEVTFSEPVTGVQAESVSVNGSAATQVTGDGAGPYVFTGFDAPAEGLVEIEVFGSDIKDLADNAFGGDAWTCTLDSTAPTIENRTPSPGAALAALAQVSIEFSEPVMGLTAGDLKVNGSAATDVTGSEGGPYVFTGYDAPPAGQITVALAAGNIVDLAGNAFVAVNWVYTIDPTKPHVKAVYHSGQPPSGPYREGQTINIAVDFDVDVTVTGNPRLRLNITPNNPYATFDTTYETNGLLFKYTVQPGDAAATLDYVNTTSLDLNGGTIKGGPDNTDADVTLAAPGGDGSLAKSDVVVDAEDPKITQFNFNPLNLTSGAATPMTWTISDNLTKPADLKLKLFLVQGTVRKPIAFSSLDTDTPRMIQVNAVTGAVTFTWHPPNRPGASRFRIEVTDETGRTGTAESPPFTIQSPVANQTTLRDFDMPGTQPLGLDAQIRSPAVCGECHATTRDNSENIVSRWQGSMMALASVDPLFEACLAIANQDAPESGDLCIRCHTPRAWLNGRSSPTDGTLIRETDRIGVACDVCHRMVNPLQAIGPNDTTNPVVDKAILSALGLDKPDFLGNGMYVIDPDLTNRLGRKRGPFVIDQNNRQHDWLQSPFFQEEPNGALMCATCHDVSNPALSAQYGLFELPDGTNPVFYEPNTLDEKSDSFDPALTMPIERTYSEWYHSSFRTTGLELAAFPVFRANGDKRARTCMDCHMRDTIEKKRADRRGKEREDHPLHDLTGGNTWVPAKLAELPAYEEIKDSLLAAATRAKYMLENAANLTAEVIAGPDGQPKQLKVKVENLTGHKLPTGYPEGRRMWLYVKVTDKFGQEYESGSFPQSGAGPLSTNAVLREKVKVYEAELLAPPAQEGGPKRHFHFVLANEIHKDNRIPPLGFDHYTFFTFGGKPVDPDNPEDWQTPTQRYADGNNWDETLYSLPKCPTKYEVKLYYQTATKEYITFLNNGPYKFAQKGHAWALDGSPPEVMESISETEIPLVPPNAPQLLNAWSVRKHGDAGEFRIPIDLSPGPNAATTECRADDAEVGRANAVELEFDQVVLPSNDPDEPEVTITSQPEHAVGTILIEGYGNKILRISFPPVPDPACLTIRLHNLKGDCNDLVMPDTEIKLRKVLGDTNNSGRVTSADVAQTKSVVATPQAVGNANFRMDVNINGELKLSDVILVKSKSLNKVTCP